MPTLRAAIYLRVSRDDPSDVQKAHVEDLVRARGWTIVDSFLDAGSTELKRRPVVNHLLASARAKRFDVIVVCGMRRICKSLREFVVLLSELGERGVEFASATERLLDTTTNATLLELVNVLEHDERVAHAETARRAAARAKRNGVRVGRPPAEFDLEAARKLKRRGYSVRRIAAELGVPKSRVERQLVPKRATAIAPDLKPARPAPRRAIASQAAFGFAAPP